MFSSVDVADPTTLITAINTFFTAFKGMVGPIVLWGIGISVMLSVAGIIYAFVNKGKRAAHR